jgi:hypothetical protein
MYDVYTCAYTVYKYVLIYICIYIFIKEYLFVRLLFAHIHTVASVSTRFGMNADGLPWGEFGLLKITVGAIWVQT